MSKSSDTDKPNPVLKGRGGRECTNGATVSTDNCMHLSVDMGATTLCGKTPDGFLMTYADVEITCPSCIAKIRG